MKKLLLIIIGLFIPLFVLAHGSGYLEFNPDYFKTKSLSVSIVGTIYQIFLPSNEFLGGVDFWFDNAGSSGIASFELRDQNSNLVTSRSITIPHINPVSGGQRVHIDFNSQVSVIGNNAYKIRISSNLPQLQIYYSDRIKFLGHNEPRVSDYINGAAEINGEEQQFSFKYTLYETSEASAPIISNIAWSVISANEMKVDFSVNEPVDYRIEYGVNGQGYTQTTDFIGDYQFCASGILSCSISIPVSANTNYQYRLTAKDSWSNQSQATGTFMSGESQTPVPTVTPVTSISSTPVPSVTPTPLIDSVPQVISNLRIVNLTNNSVDVAWTTDEVANSYLVISFTSDLLTIAAASDPTFELEHLLKIGPSLNPQAPYLARIISRDLSDNPSMASISFTTLSVGPTPATTPSPSVPPPLPSQTPIQTPLPTNIVVTSSGDGTGGGAVQWNLPISGEPSDGYRVDVFDKDGKLVKTVLVKDGSRKADIPELQDGDRIIVYTNNNGVFEKIDKPIELGAEDTFSQRLLALWPYLLIPIALGGILWWLQRRKVKNVNIKMENDSSKS